MRHTVEDYERAIRRHRQNVFNEKNGDCHERAIIRLKNTKTMRAVYAANKQRADERRSDFYLKTYA
jgi:hypothetical protein